VRNQADAAIKASVVLLNEFFCNNRTRNADYKDERNNGLPDHWHFVGRRLTTDNKKNRIR
jgi:hypothetical protein